MTEDIKKILYNLKVHNALADEEDTILLNYIINLQKLINNGKQTDIFDFIGGNL